MEDRDRSDNQLLSSIAEGDRLALEELVCRHRGKAFSLARRILGNQHDVEDVVQEACLRVCRSIGRFRQTAEFSTWLHRIVLNLCHDRLRRNSRQPGELRVDIPASSGASPEVLLGSRDAAARVQHAVEGLPERQRTAIILHRYQQLSHDQIAAVTGWSVSAIESLLVRAYRRLREELTGLK